MNVKDIVAAKEKEREDKAKEQERLESIERAKHLLNDTNEWIKRFGDNFFNENTDPQVVADIYLNRNAMKIYCPSSWLYVSYGSENVSYPQAVWKMIDALDEKFGIKLKIRERCSTRYCGSIPQDTVNGLVLWIEMV